MYMTGENLTFGHSLIKTIPVLLMASFETYVAQGGTEYLESSDGVRFVAGDSTGGAEEAAYQIIVRFRGGLTEAQKAAFKAAADRWTAIIVRALPAYPVAGEQEAISGLLIDAQGEDIDGPGSILGQAGPIYLRPASAGKAEHLPITGVMSFDTADLEKMESDGTLHDVITHEMGHVIGIGQLVWRRKGLMQGFGSSNPTFIGQLAQAEYGNLKGSAPQPVPVENEGGAGTRDSHWRETVFHNELMTGYVKQRNNPLSRLTAACLADMGYTVNMEAAEQYDLPNLMAMAESGFLMGETADYQHALPVIPLTLPDLEPF
jgi:hypothetical protein